MKGEISNGLWKELGVALKVPPATEPLAGFWLRTHRSADQVDTPPPPSSRLTRRGRGWGAGLELMPTE